MRSVESARSGRAVAQAIDDAPIIGGSVAPVHRREHAVGAALHRQMQKRHQLRHLAMGGDQPVVDIARVRGRVADAVETGHIGKRPDQLAQAPFAAVAAVAVIGVDVLPEQRDLAAPLRGEQARLVEDLALPDANTRRRACRGRRRRCRTCRSPPARSKTPPPPASAVPAADGRISALRESWCRRTAPPLSQRLGHHLG